MCPIRQWCDVIWGSLPQLSCGTGTRNHDVRPDRTRGQKEVCWYFLWFSNSMTLKGEVHWCQGSWAVKTQRLNIPVTVLKREWENIPMGWRQESQKWGYQNQEYCSKQREISDHYGNPNKPVQVCSAWHLIKPSRRFTWPLSSSNDEYNYYLLNYGLFSCKEWKIQIKLL